MTRQLYLIGAILGTILPYGFVLLFLSEHGLDLVLFGQQTFANYGASVFTTDLLITSVVLWVLVFVEGRRLGMKHLWGYVVCNLLVGLSLALPLFLYMREGKLNQ